VTTAIRGRLDTAFWIIPSAIVVSSALAGLVLLRVDRSGIRATALAFTGGPESARSALSTIATSMLTLTGLVFSITIVVLQLTSSQFSPRVLRTFLRDGVTQWTLGTFLAAFAYALLVLREVRGQSADVDEFVPGLAVTFAFALVAASQVLFVAYIHHIAQSVRVVNILARIGEETADTVTRRYPLLAEAPEHPGAPRPELASPPPKTRSVVHSGPSGVLIAVDTERLVALARREDAVLSLRVPVGSFAPAGAPLVDVSGGDVDADAVRAALAVGNERSLRDDPAFGFRQLVDVAERALSPGVNDPSTAVQALDQLHHLLRLLAGRSTDVGHHVDEDRAPRLVVPEPGWAEFLDLAVEEILHWGRDSLQVRRRVEAMLADLATVVAGDRLAAIRRLQLSLEGARCS